ncbi:MAG TPA: hypothetical protein VGS07_10050 [Thermoanaerobaculia bacterium]|jgi:hypothetical protein|nr:hypothetical protein [Thermoanaerobaculia bacterium]
MKHVGVYITAATLVVLSSAGLASADSTKDHPLITKAGVFCTDGFQYDDGNFENRYGFPSSVSAGTYGMRFQLPGANNRLTAICLCWSSLSGSSHDYGIRIWATDGPGGAPGSLLKLLPSATATGISPAGDFVRYEIPGGLDILAGAVYIAPTWDVSLFPDRFLCADETGAGGQPAYSGTASASPDLQPTLQIGTAGAFPAYRSLGIRLEAEALPACTANATTLCLNNGRFKVEAQFETGTQPLTAAQVIRLTDDTGYMWFFSSTNVEVVVKVLDACSFNQRFWVYAAGLTDQRVELTVTDTQTGVPKSYSNPLGRTFVTVTDSDAFVCP